MVRGEATVYLKIWRLLIVVASFPNRRNKLFQRWFFLPSRALHVDGNENDALSLFAAVGWSKNLGKDTPVMYEICCCFSFFFFRPKHVAALD